MEKMDEKFVGTMVVVLNKKKDKVLLGKRINCFAAGTLGVPGGRAHRNEKLEATVKRELKEETSLISNNFKYIGVVRDVYSDNTFVHFAYLCTDYKGEVALMEKDKCEGWEWYLFNKLPKNIFPAHKAAVEMCLNPKKENKMEIFNKKKLMYKNDS
ncbi:NUDIX domain-containing protein [Patescibacteria group bacterium]|nr:NUDIX domain-containing protein [Patescibacteria group bacterium]MBU2035902.1 NUDIX domain-containing protein [Patescibacteria group bacterium]